MSRDRTAAVEAAPEMKSSPVHPRGWAVLWVARVLGYALYLYLLVTEIVLLLGFILLLFGANPDPSFVQWVYHSLERSMEPFRGIFSPIDLGQTGNQVEAVLDTSILFAMIVYGFAALALRAGIDWVAQRLYMMGTEADGAM